MLERELTDLNLYAPVSGLLKPLEKVEDPIFSQKIVGEGIAIVPFERKLYAPCDGYVTYIHEAKHAMFIRTMQNIEVLLHVGIDTVELKGKGFDVHVCEKEKIKCGQLLWEVDFDLLKSRGKVIDIIVCIPCNKRFDVIEFNAEKGKVKAIENPLLRCKLQAGREENA